MTPIEYCRNKQIRMHATSRCNPITGCQYFHEGKWYSEEVFKKMFPINSLVIKAEDNYKGPNSDKTKDWMQD